MSEIKKSKLEVIAEHNLPACELSPEWRDELKDMFIAGYRTAVEKAADYIKEHYIWNNQMIEEFKKLMED